MVSSPGFGSHAYNTSSRYSHLVSLWIHPMKDLSCCTHELVGSFFNRHAVTVRRPLRLLVDIWFQNYFTPLSGVLFTFPSRYSFTIGLYVYLALPVSPGRFLQAIHVLKYSGIPIKKLFCFRVQDYYLLGYCFPAISTNKTICNFSYINATLVPYNPYHASTIGLGFSRFARRYSGNNYCSLFLRVLRCFTSPGAPRTRGVRSQGCTLWGFPIRTSSDQRLLGTFPKRIAAVPRPSSLRRTKASTIYP